MGDFKLIQKYSDLLCISASDYFSAENSYNTYIELLDRLLTIENVDDLHEIRSYIEKENPWKNEINNNKKGIVVEFNTIASVDRPILIPLLKEEKEYFQNNLTEESNTNVGIDKIQIFENRFKDFEHAFDGNFENPRVLILGINPKMSGEDHESYNLRPVYESPFDENRGILKNNKAKDDYYFSDSNGLFFKGMIDKENDKKEKLYKKVCKRIDSKEEITPVALWEFFPYASKSETEWYKDMEIGCGKKEIKYYFNLRRILPSQIWMLCLLTYTIKKAVLNNTKLTIFLKKNNKEFRENFLDRYFNYLNLEENKNIKILTKKMGLRKEFSFDNVTSYNSQWKEIDNVFDFFKTVWGIEL